MQILQPDYTDDPITSVKVIMPPALHDAMKEVARRKRVRLSLVYENALRLLIGHYDEWHNTNHISYRLADEPTGKPVNLEISHSVHEQMRLVTTVSAFYELAAKLYLDNPENYLGKQQGAKTDGKSKESGKESKAKGGSRRNRKTRKTGR